MIVQPERMAGWDLAQYIQHLADNHQQTERYEIAFWSKLFYPWAVVVMMVLALPFAFLHVRSGGVSFKIFAGVMIGVAFYGLNKLFAHLGLLNTWPPIIVAALPSLVVLATAMSALYWIERQVSVAVAAAGAAAPPTSSGTTCRPLQGYHKRSAQDQTARPSALLARRPPRKAAALLRYPLRFPADASVQPSSRPRANSARRSC